MYVSSTALALIKRFEGFSATPYLCPAGVWTVGYGHVIRAGETFRAPLTEVEAEALLMKDAEIYARAVRRLIALPLTDGQRDALISFTFNLGSGALQRSTLRRKINRGEHDDVPAEFMKWVWAGGRKLPGLIRRRKAEAECYAKEC